MRAAPASLAGNPRLSRGLTPLLPAGATLQEAASGLRNAGQFVAALHLSRNRGIPFSQLKAEMVGPDHDSLGKALRNLRPGLSSDTVKQDVHTAVTQARPDLKTSPPNQVTGSQ